MFFHKELHACLLLSSFALFAAPAQAGSICLFGSCGSFLLETSNQYHYSGYLKDLQVDASQQLPGSLNQLYNLIGVTPGAAAAVNASLVVNQYRDDWGRTTYGYGYSLSFGSVAVSGTYNLPASGSFEPSPFTNDFNTGFEIEDRLRLVDADYTFTSDNDSIRIISQSNDMPSVFAQLGDALIFSLEDFEALAISNDFPESNDALEKRFAGGSFWLRGHVQWTDSNGAALPLDNLPGILLRGTFSSSPALFEPSRDDIVVSNCGPAAQNYCTGGGVITSPSPVPVPGASLLFSMGLLSLGGAFFRKS